MIGAIASGVGAVRAGFDRLDRTAERVARAGAGGDLTGNMVEMMRARHAVKVGTAVVRAADETIGTLIDELG